MSLTSNIISLKLIAAVHQSSNIYMTYHQLVHKLHTEVDHFDWVAIHLNTDGRISLAASSGEECPFPINYETIMLIPLSSENGEILGKITVASRKRFDESDYVSLEALAQELSKKIERGS